MRIDKNYQRKIKLETTCRKNLLVRSQKIWKIQSEHLLKFPIITKFEGEAAMLRGGTEKETLFLHQCPYDKSELNITIIRITQDDIDMIFETSKIFLFTKKDFYICECLKCKYEFIVPLGKKSWYSKYSY